MKKIILLALTFLMIVGCYHAKAYYNKGIELIGDYRLETIEYQGCEYVIVQSHFKQSLVIEHKGNCHFCAERKRQELKDLVNELKGE